jgi:UDP-N-acetylmuramate dehydrogenase
MKIFKNIDNKSIKILSLLFIINFITSKYTNIKIKSIQISFNSSKNYNKQNAINKKFKRNLKSVLGPDEILENEMMSRHTTFRIGGPSKFFVKPKTIEKLVQIIKICNKYNIPFFVIGNGSNLLVSDKGYNGMIIQIREDNFSDLKIIKNDENYYILKVGGGMLMKTLSIESCLLSLTGLEDIIDIPGTVGGGIIMNASYLGTGMYKPLLKVKVVKPDGNIMELSKEECKLVGRGSLLQDKKYIVVEATFKLEKGDQMIIQKKLTENTKKRYEKQPMYFGSAGSFFKWNHQKYGSLYEKYKKANIIGYKVGNAMIYSENIAFIINLGQATSEQIMKIVNHIEKIMKDNFNINIEREVVVIGSFNNIEYY